MRGSALDFNISTPPCLASTTIYYSSVYGRGKERGGKREEFKGGTTTSNQLNTSPFNTNAHYYIIPCKFSIHSGTAPWGHSVADAFPGYNNI